MTDPAVKMVVDDIVRSPEDKRVYKGLEFTNGLKVMLVSDPTTDKSSAALDVQIGERSRQYSYSLLAAVATRAGSRGPLWVPSMCWLGWGQWGHVRSSAGVVLEVAMGPHALSSPRFSVGPRAHLWPGPLL